jgi:tetratricopeptide (TPR) repeat protein
MGKDEVLDARGQPVTELAGLSDCPPDRGKILPVIFAAIISCLITGCSLPRIIVLDDPLTPEEHLNLGVSYEKNNELDPAVEEYKAAAKSLPIAYLYLGNVSFVKGDFADAEKYYKKAVEKDPSNADAFNNLAWLYYTQGRNLEEAEASALRAIELNPGKADIYRDTLEKVRSMKGK